MTEKMQDESAGFPSGYAAFISYSHRDEKIAAWLQSAIERYVVPQRLVGRTTVTGVIPRRLGKCFRDRDELPAGSDLNREIISAIERCKFMVVVCSPAAAESPWVNLEVLTFKRSHGTDRVIAVIADGEPFAKPGEAMSECLPGALRFRLDDDGALTNEPAEPIAADLRPGKDPKRIVLLKVLAGMLGLGLDDLVQREAQRRQRIYGWVASGAVLASLAFAGLAVVAVQQRNIALKATTKAAERRKQAEGLIEFMITDLHDKLDTVGRLDVLDTATTRALTYFASLSPDEMDATATGQKTRVLNSLGNQQTRRGQQNQALGSFMMAWQSAQDALAKTPTDPSRLHEYATSLHSLGYYYYMRSDFDKAGDFFRQALEVHARSLAIEDNIKWRRDVGISQKNLGVVYLNQMKFAESIVSFENARITFEYLRNHDPSKEIYISDYGDSLGWKSDALRHIGATNEAIALRQIQITLYRDALAQSPENKSLQSAEIAARRRVASLKVDAANYNDAYHELLDVERDTQKIYDFDKSNIAQLVRLTGTSFELFRAALLSGHLLESRKIMKRANDEYDRLNHVVEGQTTSTDDMASQYHLSRCLYWTEKHEYKKSIAEAQSIVDDLRKHSPHQSTTASINSTYNRLLIAYLAAQAYDQIGRSDQALEVYRLIEASVGALPPPRSILVEAIRAKILPLLGRNEDSAQSLQLVCRSDYRRVIGVDGCKDLIFKSSNVR
jgi:tetratricopeptide (TPR) repeat protein